MNKGRDLSKFTKPTSNRAGNEQGGRTILMLKSTVSAKSLKLLGAEEIGA